MTPDGPNISSASWTNWPVEALMRSLCGGPGPARKKSRQEVLSQLSQFRAAVVVPGYHQDLPIDQVVHDGIPSIRQTVDHFVATGRRKLGMLDLRVLESVQNRYVRGAGASTRFT